MKIYFEVELDEAVWEDMDDEGRNAWLDDITNAINTEAHVVGILE